MLGEGGGGADKGEKGKEKLDRIDSDFLGNCRNGCLLGQVWYCNHRYPTLVWLVISLSLSKGHGHGRCFTNSKVENIRYFVVALFNLTLNGTQF